MSVKLQTLIEEAQRQVQICNACRYCEGYCAVFPAINRQRSFKSSDIIQLANLCHNCQGCYHACQYTEPHEFNINLPQSLAEVRVDSWHSFIRPLWLSRTFQQHGVAIAAMIVLAIALLFILMQTFEPEQGNGFYAFLSHTTMITLFIPAFLAPLIIIWLALKTYWQTIEGSKIKWLNIQQALASVATMKNLSGGHGEGCNYEVGDRYSNKRRWFHQATMYGFLLCFASTASGTLLHYLLNIQAPYPLFSIPKLLGIPGGLLLVIGCGGLAWLKTKADRSLGAPDHWGGEMAFVLLLGATGASGLILFFVTGSDYVATVLAIHLGTVFTLFLLMPYSKMVHGFFRLASLIKDAQLKSG